jgi:hypothetical protein
VLCVSVGVGHSLVYGCTYPVQSGLIGVVMLGMTSLLNKKKLTKKQKQMVENTLLQVVQGITKDEQDQQK